MRAGCGADDTASMPGRDNRYVKYAIRCFGLVSELNQIQVVHQIIF